jgi:hypothetical protein
MASILKAPEEVGKTKSNGSTARCLAELETILATGSGFWQRGSEKPTSKIEPDNLMDKKKVCR